MIKDIAHIIQKKSVGYNGNVKFSDDKNEPKYYVLKSR
tara:strand:- start:250 stop:363 length:114 start_codon:yes stop_codon:yes gene_type:complete